jgi:hypothetical protein
MQDKIENNLLRLQEATNNYKVINPLADWVLFAVSRYISSRKAPKDFERAFANFDSKKFGDLVKECLRGDKSDDGIIKTCKRIMLC